jgi:hypothetical protein
VTKGLDFAQAAPLTTFSFQYPHYYVPVQKYLFDQYDPKVLLFQSSQYLNGNKVLREYSVLWLLYL